MLIFPKSQKNAFYTNCVR